MRVREFSRDRIDVVVLDIGISRTVRREITLEMTVADDLAEAIVALSCKSAPVSRVTIVAFPVADEAGVIHRTSFEFERTSNAFSYYVTRP